ncbi:MAG: hypothetical protein Q8N05_12715 [Bacteroidota bacterium]|nr:hypothetical protein [Bacteroidota bacterium]
MVQLIPIENSEEIDPEFKQIYTEAFPPEERRDWQQLIDLLPNSKFKIYKISFQNRFIGIISIWKLAGFNFIEHFAIRDSTGKREVKMLLMSYPEKIHKNEFEKIKTQIHQVVSQYWK